VSESEALENAEGGVRTPVAGTGRAGDIDRPHVVQRPCDVGVSAPQSGQIMPGKLIVELFQSRGIITPKESYRLKRLNETLRTNIRIVRAPQDPYI